MKKILSIIVLTILLFSLINCKKQTDEKVITIPLVTWGGYAALFAANGGAEPNEDSLFYKYGNFKVKLVQIEDPSLHLTGFSKGDYPIIWSTMDMLPLLYDSLSQDPASIPKVIGLFDYSAGGDGIIVRHGITEGSQLKGKKVVAAQYTPSHFFLLWYLKQNGLKPNDVDIIYTEDAISAKDSYVAESALDGCVTWSPFIYDITDPEKETYIRGSSLIMTTSPQDEAYGVIADVYLARADFIKNNPEMVSAFTKAMLEGYQIYKNDPEKVAGEIANLFGIKGGVEEVMLMFGDVTIGNAEENNKFFSPSEEFSAKNIFNLSMELYKAQGKLNEDFFVDPMEIIAPEYMLENINNE